MKLLLDTPTAWASKSGKGYYTLGALWFQIENKDLKPGDYMRKANEFGVQSILVGEKQEIVHYFTRLKQESDSIDI